MSVDPASRAPHQLAASNLPELAHQDWVVTAGKRATKA
jgi:hypothetical protein